MSGVQPPVRVLLVDDEAIARNLHNAMLQAAGFETEAVASLAELRDSIARRRYDIILLDLQLPDGNALELVAELRRDTSAGIIIATASGNAGTRLTGLERGADEYLEKPLHPRELIARVRNLAARLGHVEQQARGALVHRFEGWTVDLAAREVSGPEGGVAHLTGNEFRILEALIRDLPRPVHRDRLLALLGEDEEITQRAVDRAIYRLRIKLRSVVGDATTVVETVHGLGYRLVARRL